MKIFYIKLLIIMLIFCIGCEEDAPSPLSQPQTGIQTPAIPAIPRSPENSILDTPLLNASKSAERDINNWYLFADDQDKSVLADNLTAKNYMLVFDGSGSMLDSKCSAGRSKIEVAKDAVVEWSKSIPQDAYLGLVAFHNQGWETMPLTTGDREIFISKIHNLIAGGATPLTEAFKYAYEKLILQGQSQLGYGEYTIVVVTDGIANNEATLSQWVKRILKETPIMIYTIGFCIGEQHSLNQPGYTIYKAADNPAELKRGLQEVLAESEEF